MNYHRYSLFSVLIFILFFFSLQLESSGTRNLKSGRKILWQIGKADNNTSGFALAPGGYGEFNLMFPDDVLFIVGQSNPEKDWPYTQPGPDDSWAGGKQHTFKILFGIKEKASRGKCTLKVDLANTHGIRPPTLDVKINNIKKSISCPKGGTDASITGDQKAGIEYCFAIDIPGKSLNRGLNEIAIKSVSGSWILYDSICLETPGSFELDEAKGTLMRSIKVSPFLTQRGNKLYQKVSVVLTQFGKEPGKTITVSAAENIENPKPGTNTFNFFMPPVNKNTKATVVLKNGNKVIKSWMIKRTHAFERELVDWADPLLGTSSSRWMLYPGPSMPFGMVKLSPDNQRRCWKAGYEYGINNIAGFSHLHSWTMGALLTMPITGELKTKPGTESDPDQGYRSRINHDTEVAWPGYYAVTLEDYKIRAELTATTRAGFQRYTFPKSKTAYILFDLLTPTEYGYAVLDAQVKKISPTRLEGYSKQRSTSWNHYTVYFVAEVSKPCNSFGGWIENSILHDVKEIKGKGDVGVFLEYSTRKGEVIKLKTGISLVSIEQARLNLETEMSGFKWDFESARAHGRMVWNDLLGKIKVEGGTDIQKTKFYTNLYRSYCARTILSDVNGKYVDMCEKVRQLEDPDSPVYGCDAFWNTFWNLNQLWTLVTPDIANKWVKSLLEIYDRGGWLPKGPTGIEYSSIMVASHEISLIVSSYQKGIRNYDVQKAYKAMKEIQMNPGRNHDCGGRVGNMQLSSYKKLGYVPVEKGPASNTLEYAYDDWCVGQMAKALGKEKDYEYFDKRSMNYKNIFDPSVGYDRERHADGTWVKNFNAFSGKGFVEGNSWQYTWFVPHDMAGLIKLLGKKEFNTRLNKGHELSLPNRFNATGDRMSAYPVNHGNQPNMESAYLYNFSGKPWLSQKWARAIMKYYYGTGPYDGYPGDEDQGQMGAWYVMSAMGLFEMDGGASVRPIYEIGSPIFDRITIQLDQKYYKGKEFTIETINNSDNNIYIQSAVLNGKPLNKPWFYHSQLVDGGKLTLIMGPKPNKNWGSAPEDAPPQ